MMMFFSSFGSLGVSKINNSSSSSDRRASVSVISAFANSANSPPSFANSLASRRFCSNVARSSPLAISVSSSENRLFLLVKSGEPYASGRAKKSPSAARSAFNASRSREIFVIWIIIAYWWGVAGLLVKYR